TIRQTGRPPCTREKIREILKKCELCQYNKKSKNKVGKIYGNLHSKYPFQDISMDIYGPLIDEATDDSTEKFILGIIDRCTRNCKLIALQNITSKTVTEVLESEWCNLYGEPHSILTDRGVSLQHKNLSNTVKKDL
ncbi:putative transposable element, partial [Pseudoloma neurophilia]